MLGRRLVKDDLNGGSESLFSSAIACMGSEFSSKLFEGVGNIHTLGANRWRNPGHCGSRPHIRLNLSAIAIGLALIRSQLRLFRY